MKKVLLTLLSVVGALCLYSEEKQNPAVALVYPVAPLASPVKLDGLLDESAWSKAVNISSFTDSGSPNLSVQQTVMRIAYDKDNLYLGITCAENSMKTILCNTSGPDAPFYEDDSIEFFIDINHDHTTYYQLAVTAGGATYDNHNGDSLWTKPWKSAVSKHADRWCVEIKVPFSIFQEAPPTVGSFWGFNLCRERHAGGKLELSNWADVERVFNKAHLFGHLLFMPTNWENNIEAIGKAKQGAGRIETQLQTGDGYWQLLPTGGKPVKLSLLDAYRKRFQFLPPRADELNKLFKANPELPQKKQFDKLLNDFNGHVARSRSVKDVGSVQFAQANIFYISFLKSIDTIYWQSKLAVLNKQI